MTAQQVRTIVAMLQREPLYYRHYGYYWWWIKNALRAAGVTRDELPTLGDYTDLTCEDWYKTQDPKTLFAEAHQHAYDAASEMYGRNTHAVPVRAGGGVYLTYDGDVE